MLDRTYRLQTISYAYDALSRLREARTAAGVNVQASDAQLLRREVFSFDRSGNRTQQSLALNGAAASVTSYSYNSANQLISDGTNSYSYDPNGNLTSNTWDRANRLLSAGGASFAYDGAGNRIRQTVGADVTRYLLDLQPGLALVLSQSMGANTERYVHGPRGIHAQRDAANNWDWLLQDGLGSVRQEVDASLNIVTTHTYTPYGIPDTPILGFAFTGEMRDANGLQYHRARYYSPTLGIWISEDFLETPNRYSYVGGNPINRVDPDGYCEWPTNWLNPLDARCRYLAEGLANRFGFPVENIIHLPYHELEALTALGTFADVSGYFGDRFRDAAIIPKLFLENPQIALQALQQYSCDNRGSLLGTTAFLFANVGLRAFSGLVSTAGNGVGGVSATGIGLAIAGGITLAVAGVLVIDSIIDKDWVKPIEPEMKRRWICNTRCQLAGSDSNCSGYIDGIGRGNSQAEACQAAKFAINIQVPRGCYKRHCGCDAPGNNDCRQI